MLEATFAIDQLMFGRKKQQGEAGFKLSLFRTTFNQRADHVYRGPGL